MSKYSRVSLILFGLAGLAACTDSGSNPVAVSSAGSPSFDQDREPGDDDEAGGSRMDIGADDDHDLDDDVEDPIVARVNLNVTLRGVGRGHIKFRQPSDAFFIVFLDTRVHHLAANTDYQLQRATDAVVDDNCTGVNWLTLGQLSAPLVIHTDARGKGAAQFSRDLTTAAGAQFDIHFRVIDAVTKAVALESGCYQFKVSQ